jgi:hypothetical protein
LTVFQWIYFLIEYHVVECLTVIDRSKIRLFLIYTII